MSLFNPVINFTLISFFNSVINFISLISLFNPVFIYTPLISLFNTVINFTFVTEREETKSRDVTTENMFLLIFDSPWQISHGTSDTL